MPKVTQVSDSPGPLPPSWAPFLISLEKVGEGVVSV